MSTTAAHEGRLLGVLSLFTSFGTLICCALPSLLVLFGLGATVASVLCAYRSCPITDSEVSWPPIPEGSITWPVAESSKARALACPIDDPRCSVATRFSKVVLWISAAIWAAGAFTAFLLGRLLTRFN
jgi:mercuric ion transport protein